MQHQNRSTKRNRQKSKKLKIAQLKKQVQQTRSALEVAQAELKAPKSEQSYFLSQMSHELRTPLGTIIGYSEMMLKRPDLYEDGELSPDHMRDLARIHSSSQQLLHLINDLLDLANLDAGTFDINMKEIDLESLLDWLMGNASARLDQKQIHLSFQTPQFLSSVYACQTSVYQILMKLYDNAIRHTSQGTITLTVSEKDENTVQFALTDTGGGIPPRVYDDLVERFKEAETGHYPISSYGGFGLAIAYQLVQLMGGRLWFESVAGNGTTFYFTLKKYIGQDKTG